MEYLRWCIMEKGVIYKSVANIMFFFYEQKEELRVKKTFLLYYLNKFKLS